MENTLSKYINQELKDIISSVQVFQGTAKDTGSIYYAIDLKFINGYQKRLFLKSDESFAWINAIELLHAQKDVDVMFK